MARRCGAGSRARGETSGRDRVFRHGADPTPAASPPAAHAPRFARRTGERVCSSSGVARAAARLSFPATVGQATMLRHTHGGPHRWSASPDATHWCARWDRGAWVTSGSHSTSPPVPSARSNVSRCGCPRPSAIRSGESSRCSPVCVIRRSWACTNSASRPTARRTTRWSTCRGCPRTPRSKARTRPLSTRSRRGSQKGSRRCMRRASSTATSSPRTCWCCRSGVPAYRRWVRISGCGSWTSGWLPCLTESVPATVVRRVSPRPKSSRDSPCRWRPTSTAWARRCTCWRSPWHAARPARGRRARRAMPRRPRSRSRSAAFRRHSPNWSCGCCRGRRRRAPMTRRR